MLKTAALKSQLLEIAIAPEEMAATVLLIGEWLLKQQQQLKQQQRQLEEQQRLIEAQQQQIEQLNEALDKVKKRSSANSSIPPSADQLKKSSDKSKRKKGKKRGPKYDHPGKTRNGFGEPIDGIKYWLWVATSDQVCVLLLAPTRSSAELKQLLGQDFSGILSSDCFSAYNPQSATAKQKCLTHLERDLEALKTSRFEGNRLLAQAVTDLLASSRQVYRDYQAGKFTRQEIAAWRLVLESQLQTVLDNPPLRGWPADAQRLVNRIKRHWHEWFTFLSHPEVKPDNNDAERALRPVVVHRKVSGGARSDWGAKLVAQMFSFLETVRLQAGEAIAQLYELLSLAGRSPPGLHLT